MRLERAIKLLAHRAAWLPLFLGVAASPAWAQAPDEDWRRLETEHFRVTFPAELEGLARRAADRAEVAWAALAGSLVEPPGRRIDMVVTDHTDLSNGYAQLRPSNRIVIFARPPVDGPTIVPFDEWLELVITHELAHIVHLDHTRMPLGTLARAIFGRAANGWPFFPNLATPGWVIEGLATWYESYLTDSGREDGTFHEMVLRTGVLEGRFESLGQAAGSSPLWPGGTRYYAYGELFFDYLVRRYGEEGMGAFAEAVAGQWIPFRLDAAGRDAFGVPLTDAWEEWEEELRDRYSDYDAELARLGPVTTPERLSDGARWAYYPSVSPDGRTLVHAQADGRSDSRLTRRPASGGPAEAVGRTNGLATFDWLPNGRLLVSQLEQAGPYRTFADLWIMDLEGASTRLTHRARLDQPDVAPDGTWALAVEQGGGTSALVRVDVATGEVEPLVPAHPDVHWSFPRISPDGRWIAATRWEPNAFLDVVILDASTGREVHRVTRDRAMDLAPAWSPDSRWVVWSSDRTGVMNILGAEVEPASGRAGPPVLLTNVRTGLLYPSIDPTGGWIYASGYHVDGWEAERVPFDPTAYGPAPAPDPRFDAPDDPPPSGEAPGEVGGYNPFPTVLPYYWQPRYRQAVVAPEAVRGGVTLPRTELLPFGIGLETSGLDLVGRHSWVAYGQIFTDWSEVEGGFGYAYGGLGNPILSVTANQVWESAGSLLTNPQMDTLYVLEREQRLDGSVAYTDAGFRRSITVALGGGMVWEARRLLDARAEPTSEYGLARPTSRLAEVRASLGYSSARTHSFQVGNARGLSAVVAGRRRIHLDLPDADAGVVGIDRSFDELTGRLRGYVPLWGGGYATHVLGLQLAGGAAFGPNAQFGHFGVGGAAGQPEVLGGYEVFGGSYIFLPVRGYPTSSRAGRYGWSASAEYRFPIALLNWGLGPWPLFFDRILGSVFVDTGNAWEPNPRERPLTAVGGELTIPVLGFFRSAIDVRAGLGVPLVDATQPQLYLRAGLAF